MTILLNFIIKLKKINFSHLFQFRIYIQEEVSDSWIKFEADYQQGSQILLIHSMS